MASRLSISWSELRRPFLLRLGKEGRNVSAKLALPVGEPEAGDGLVPTTKGEFWSALMGVEVMGDRAGRDKACLVPKR